MPTFAPATRSTDPESGSEFPDRILSKVVLPAPLRPTKPSFSPASTASVAPERTFRSPPWNLTISLAIRTFMTARLYREDPLTPEERDEFERDIISFCDRELDLLGDITGLNVLYAGGSSLLWLEGLSQRIGVNGSLTALDTDAARIEEARNSLPEAELPAPVRLVEGDVFAPPFEPGTFDLVYSSGLFHELDVKSRSAGEALAALAATVRPGGRISTSDFVESELAVQIEDEELQRDVAQAVSGSELYGVGSPERLVALHEAALSGVRSQLSAPYIIRHLDKVVLAEIASDELASVGESAVSELRARRADLLERVRREGYTRPATLYVEGRVVK